MSATKAPDRGSKSTGSSSTDEGDPEEGLQHGMSEPLAPAPEPSSTAWDTLIDHTLLQTEGHLPSSGALGRNRRVIARIAAQARIKRYFVQSKPG